MWSRALGCWRGPSVVLVVIQILLSTQSCRAFCPSQHHQSTSSGRSRPPTQLHFTEHGGKDEELLHRALLEARLGGSASDLAPSGTSNANDTPNDQLHRALLAARLEFLSLARKEASNSNSSSNSQLSAEVWLGSDAVMTGEDDEHAVSALLASLQARRDELKSKSAQRREVWVNAKCQSSVRLTLDDWIRRLDLKRWPVAALGSAKGSVVVANLDRGEVVARVDDAHSKIGGNPNANTYMHGEFDGGGTTAVAIKGDSVISAGREGGAKAWRLDHDSGELVALGGLAGLEGKQVTALEIDADSRLWVGVFDGTFEGSVVQYDLLDPAPLSAQTPTVVKLRAGVLSLAISSETALVAAGTTDGTVELISMEQGTHIESWKVHVSDSSTHIRAVDIFQAGRAADEEEGSNQNWCVVAGGGDGSMRMRWLETDGATAVVDLSQPFDISRLPLVIPNHNGMVVSLTGCKQNGLLVSGAQDGTLRVYDFCADITAEEEEGDAYTTELDFGSEDDLPNVEIHPIILYQLAGYKVWLSSICVDEKGLRLVTDGADNTVVVHDYSVPLNSIE